MKKSILLTVSSILFALVAVLVVDQLSLQMINNGDYGRVARSMFVKIDVWTPNPQCIPFDDQAARLTHFIPISTMAVIAMPIALVYKAFSVPCLPTEALFYVLSSIYWTGSILSNRNETTASQLSGLFLFSLIYATYGIFFKSLYEEAAILALLPIFVFFWKNMCASPSRFYGFIAVSSLLICAKAQMAFLTPFIIFEIFSARRRDFPATALLISCLFVVTVTVGNLAKPLILGASDINAYNRLFNGLGWSLQKVKDWPADHYYTRQHYFEKNREQLQDETLKYETSPNRSLLGTSYWPDGTELLGGPADANRQLRRDELRKELTPSAYFRFFFEHPESITALLANTYSVAARSDYSLVYLQNNASNTRPLPQGLTTFRNIVGSVTGIIFLAMGALCFFDPKKSELRAATAYYFLGAPLIIVVGDGFYEFEKHMMPFLFLSFAFLFFSNLGRSDTSRVTTV